LFSTNGIQNIPRLGDVRQVDLGLDFVSFGARRARRSGRSLRFTGGAEMGTHFDRFVVLNGAGMSFLLGNSDQWEHVKNRFALNFQFPGQIVDSNLAHPPFLSSGLSR
jgi:hypothetical protein